MNTIKDQIRAEIKRLKRQLIRGACSAQIEMETNCKDEAYNEVLAKLDTLKEQPVELEKEIKETFDKDITTLKSFGAYSRFARHFYNLGRQSKDQPVCEGLEEEIYNYANTIAEGTPLFEIIPQTARHFAQWQKEQMMKEAVEGTIFPTIRTKEIDEQMFDNIISRFNGEHFKYEMLQAMKRWLVELRKKLFLLNEAVKVEGEVTETCGIASIWIKTKQFKHGDKVKLIIIKEEGK